MAASVRRTRFGPATTRSHLGTPSTKPVEHAPASLGWGMLPLAPPLECRTQTLVKAARGWVQQSRYIEVVQAVLSTDRAKAFGAYYTDTAVADFLVRWAVRDPGDVVLDPSSG